VSSLHIISHGAARLQAAEKSKMGKSKKSEKRKEKEENAKRATLLLFSKYYMSQYGAERWQSLFDSLRKPVRYCALINRWANREFTERLLGIDTGECIQLLEDYLYAYVKITPQLQLKQIGEEQGGEMDDHERERTEESIISQRELLFDEDGEVNDDIFNENVFTHRWPAPGIPSSLDENDRCCYYPLDGASLLPVIALNLTPDSRVYDMCAAPGGKSLVIASYLFPNNSSLGTLTCSDISPNRRLRLFNTFRRYLPSEFISNKITILAGDATSKQFFTDNHQLSQFDRILVDAPCSSERHVLHSSDELSRWTSGRSKLNSDRQIQLLSNALKICSIPGRVVYSTCSLSQHENDDVVMKVVKKINKKFSETVASISSSSSPTGAPKAPKIPYVRICQVNPEKMPFGEPTEYGWHILPDRSDGWGPIYFSVMEVLYKGQEIMTPSAHDVTMSCETREKNHKKLSPLITAVEGEDN
jgi:16S rRNA C967 or C1407 C5-methylase (RsmB/RsmF family)